MDKKEKYRKSDLSEKIFPVRSIHVFIDVQKYFHEKGEIKKKCATAANQIIKQSVRIELIK